MDEGFIAALHAENLLDPALWAEQADHLKAVADLIKPEVVKYWQLNGDAQKAQEHFYSAFLMLNAYALENCLKGILVSEHAEVFRDELQRTKRLPTLIRTHNITNLCKATCVSVEPKEGEDLWHQLSAAAEWSARYPAPVSPHGYKIATINDQKGILLKLYSPTDIPNIDKTFTTLRRRLQKKIAQQSDTFAVSAPPDHP